MASSLRGPLLAAAAVGMAALAALALLRLAEMRWRVDIERNMKMREEAEVRAVLGEGGEVRRMEGAQFLELLPDAGPPPQAWALVADGGVSAVAVAASVRDGYSGPVRLVVGVDSRLTIMGVRAIEHKETPGIGDFIGRAGHPWMAGFRGRAAARADAVAGATVTSAAVSAAVDSILAALAQRPPFGSGQ